MSIAGLLLAFALMVFGIVLVTERVPTLNEAGEEISIAFKFTPKPLLLWNFVDPTSIIIVLGGTVATLMLSFPGSQFKKVPKHLKIIVAPKQYVPQDYIEKLVECAKKARVSGLLALEEDISSMEDSFMRSSMLMVVDSVDPEKVKQQLGSWLDNLEERHAQERGFYDKGAALAPAFGMIGTLIGLINMMKDISDSASIGPNMAVALITTFYGSFLSNVVFIPISTKLKVRHDEEFLCKLIICEGVEAIQAGENPKFIQERLVNMLPEYQQRKLNPDGGGEDGEEGGGKKGKRGKKK